MNSIGIGVIGCGRISEVHLNAIAAHGDARLVCVADVNVELAQRQAEKYQAGRWVADYREMLEMPEVQAVVICVPTFLHAEIVCAAAAAGKHALCEKPIAMTLADADRMIAACKEADTRLMLGFVRRFSTEWQKLREVVQSGRLGRPVIWRNNVAIRLPLIRWFVDAEKGGGPFIDGCVHDYDTARLMFGEVTRVQASLTRFSQTTTAWDTGTAIIRFESGDELVRSWSWGLPDPKCVAPQTQDVIGPGGALRFADGSSKDPKVDCLSFINENGESEPIEFERTTGQDWFTRQMAHFITCVQEGREPMSTGADGRKGLEIGLAVLKAGTTGETVYLK